MSWPWPDGDLSAIWAERDLTDLRTYRELKLTWLTWPLPDRERTMPWVWSDRDLPWVYRELTDLTAICERIVSWVWPDYDMTTTLALAGRDLTASWLRAYRVLSVACNLTSNVRKPSVTWLWSDRELTVSWAWPVIWPLLYFELTATSVILTATWSWAYYELNVTVPPGWMRMKS